MKKNLFALNISAIILLCACHKEADPSTSSDKTTGEGVEYTLTGILEDNEIKTTIGTINETKYAVWSDNDAISVFNEEGQKLDMSIVSHEGTYAKFRTESEIKDFASAYAVYPQSINATIDESTFSIDLPATQSYAENTFADNMNVSVATVNKSVAKFRNVCGYLNLKLTGTDIVTKIELKGVNDEKLNGSFTVDATAGNPVAVATDTRKSGDDVITLDCGDGVQLSENSETSFLFVVPVLTFDKGFYAIVHLADKPVEHIDLFTLKEQKISRSSIHNMAALKVDASDLIPDEYTEVEYIESPCQYGDNKGTVIKWDNGNSVNSFKVEMTAQCLSVDPEPSSGISYLFSLNGSTDVNHGVYMGVNWSVQDNWFIPNDALKYPNVSRYNKCDITLTKQNQYEAMQLKVEGDENTYSASLSTLNVNSFYFFGNSDAKPYCGAFRLYKAKISKFDESVVYGDLVPVRRNEDGKFGLYDKIQQKFFASTKSTYGEITGPLN